MQRSVHQRPRHDTAALAIDHDEIENEILDEKLCPNSQGLPIQRVDQSMSRSIRSSARAGYRFRYDGPGPSCGMLSGNQGVNFLLGSSQVTSQLHHVSPLAGVRCFPVESPLVMHSMKPRSRRACNVLVTLLIEGQRATVLQLPVVHQISERTTKAEEHGSTPAAAASAAGRSCAVPAMPSGVSATKPGGVGGHFLQAGVAGNP
jgi:hypothetical protein